MKTSTLGTLKKHGLVTILLMSMAPGLVLAQDALLDDTASALNMSVSNEQIDIDGTVHRESMADKMAKQRKALEKRHEEMVHKKIEVMRMREEQKIANQLRKALNGQAMAVDSIGTRQAAPQKMIATLPTIKKAKTNKVFLLAGGKEFTSQQTEAWQASFSAGLGFETVLAKRVGLGLSVGYTKMNLQDVARIGSSNILGGNYGINNGYNNGYNNGLYPNTSNTLSLQGDEINYNNLSFGLNGKFYITVDTTVQPYIGGGVSYNRTTLEYNTKTNLYSQFNNGVNDSVSAGYLSGGLHAGADFNFTNTFGMTLDLGYTKSLTKGFDKDERSYLVYRNFDEIALNNIGKQIEQADVLSVDLGLNIKF